MGKTTESAEHSARRSFFLISLQKLNRQGLLSTKQSGSGNVHCHFAFCKKMYEWEFVSLRDLKEKVLSWGGAVWLAESGRSSAEMFCRASSLGESCSLSPSRQDSEKQSKSVTKQWMTNSVGVQFDQDESMEKNKQRWAWRNKKKQKTLHSGIYQLKRFNAIN